MAKKALAKKKAGRTTLDANPQQLLRNGHIAIRLREEVAKRGWKAPDLSAATSGARDGVMAYRWLSGKSAPSPRFAEMLVNLFGGSINDFLPRDPDVATATPRAELISLDGPAPVKRPNRAAAEVFAFTVNEAGMARLKLDVSLPMSKARSLFTTLLQSGLLPDGTGHAEEKEPEQ